SPASNCSVRSGATTTSVAHEPSTCTSVDCARSSAISNNSSAPSATSATASTCTRMTVRPPVLRRRSLQVPAHRAAFTRLVRVATTVDGQAPFNDQALIDAQTGARQLVFIVEPQESPSATEHLVGAAIV